MSCLTYPVDVADGTVWEVVVYDKVHSLEVNPSSHQLCANENPDVSQSETFHDVVALEERKVYM